MRTYQGPHDEITLATPTGPVRVMRGGEAPASINPSTLGPDWVEADEPPTNNKSKTTKETK